MIKILSMLALVISIAFASFAQNGKKVDPDADPNAPVIRFDVEVLNIGTVKYASNVIREFKFKNAGKSSLLISMVKPQCGCISPTIDGQPILPGKTGTIKVKYDTTRIGSFEFDIIVISNATDPSKTVKLKGVVEAAPAQSSSGT